VNDVETLIARLLDPVSAIACLLVVASSHRPVIVPVAAALAVIVTQTLRVATGHTSTWGDESVSAVIAAIAQAAAFFALRSAVSRPRAGDAGSEAPAGSTRRDGAWSVWHFAIPGILIVGPLTEHRLGHFLWALLFCALGLVIDPRRGRVFRSRSEIRSAFSSLASHAAIAPLHAWTLAAVVVFMGGWIPDIDWHFGSHRSALTHSVLPLVAMRCLVSLDRLGDSTWNRSLLALFGYALASHLVVDGSLRGNVAGIPKFLELPFMLGNAALALVLAHRAQEQALRMAAPLPGDALHTDGTR